MAKFDESALSVIRKRGGTWAAYENKAMDSSSAGDRICLQFGKGCTYEAPPPCLPDGPYGSGWKYVLIGIVDLESGEITDGKQGNVASSVGSDL